MSTPTATTAPLNDVMLAMDVVDTLRHSQDLVARELDAETRERQLIEKLRAIYHEQGIEVPDHILREGVAALAESRFAYTPPAPGLGTFLARMYVGRKRWGPLAVALLLIVVLGLGGYFLGYRPLVAAQQASARVELAETLPAEMDALYRTIFEETKIQQASNQAEALVAQGKAFAAEGNREGALTAIRRLTEIRDTLRQRYVVRVVNQPGEKSAVWTFPEINTEATNYYLIVEALDPDGRLLSLPVVNEESGVTEDVKRWGLRVSEAVYQSVVDDKLDDGIIQNNRVGEKVEGYLDAKYVPGVLGGAITRW